MLTSLRAFLIDPQTWCLIHLDFSPPSWIRWQEITWHIEFKLQDMWFGLFWNHVPDQPDENWKRSGVVNMWITLIPTFPVHVIIPYKEQ